jgi:hypothetical protein
MGLNLRRACRLRRRRQGTGRKNHFKESWFDLLGYLCGNCYDMDSLANGMLQIHVISSNGDLPGIDHVDHGLLKEPMITDILRDDSPKPQRTLK